MLKRSAVLAGVVLPWSTFAKKLTALSLGILLSGLGMPVFADPPAEQPQRNTSGPHANAIRFRVLPNQPIQPGNLLLSRTVYDNNPNNVTVGEILPPNCANTTGGCSASSGATDNGEYPTIWNNDIYDASFGITSAIYLDQITLNGVTLSSFEVPNSSMPGVAFYSDQLVTSFSSKSELALNLSLDGSYVTFMGYVAPVDLLDVSNSNTPGAVDTTNPVGQNYYRAVAQMDADRNFKFTETNAYSGNNGRAAILNNTAGADFFYTAGNAGNGANPQPAGVVLGAGTQFITPTALIEASQTPPASPTPLASFSVTEIGAKADKLGKDDNFRGLTIYNNVVYLSKGSGSNGANTVYFVDTTANACPNGTGIPSSTAALPATPLSYDMSTLLTSGLPDNMCILAGFPATSNKDVNPVNYPFGIWFANPTTLYVADEGDGYTGGSDLYSHAATQTYAGLEKWVFDTTTNSWNLAYTLQNGLNLGMPYSVAAAPITVDGPPTVSRRAPAVDGLRNMIETPPTGPAYPTGDNPATGLPWAPAPDGLRNITGRVNADGTATVFAITSTVSGNGDTGADPNQLVSITDSILNTNPSIAANESFVVLRTADFAEALRGVSFTPGTDTTAPTQVPYPVTASKPAYNLTRGFYTEILTIRNNTTTPLTGPVYLEFRDLSARLVNGTLMDGWPTLQILSSDSTLNPGAAVAMTVSFARPFNGPISFNPVVTE